ncbi:MAG: hypothetical protein IPP40_15980 [bacterium]|nr:hypothetical protein [bacterium]
MFKKILALSVMIACAITFSQTANAQAVTKSTLAPQPNALITLVSPNGGEIIKQNTSTIVTWTADPSLQSFTVELWCAPDTKWSVLAKDLPMGTTSFVWNVTQPPSTKCLIKVTGVNVTAQYIEDVSDDAFQIQ